MPRFRRTGRPEAPAARSRGATCMLREPIWIASAYSATNDTSSNASSARACSASGCWVETRSDVAPDSRHASRRSARRSFGPTSATSSMNASGTAAAASRLLPGEVEVLDLAGGVLVSVPAGEVVVEVLPARAHPADVQRVVRLQELAARLDVVDEDGRRGGGDVEPLARVRDHVAERVARLLRRPEDREPAVGDLECLRDRLGTHHREVDRDVRAERAGHQLQRLAEAGAVRERDVVVGAMVLDEFAAKRRADDLDVLARLLERLSPRLAVPALDDLRPGRPETEQEAAAGQEVERGCRHRRVRRRAAGDLHDRRAELDPLRHRARARRARSRSRFPRPRRPMPSRIRAAPPPAPGRAARADSCRAARTPCRSRASCRAMLTP